MKKERSSSLRVRFQETKKVGALVKDEWIQKMSSERRREFNEKSTRANS